MSKMKDHALSLVDNEAGGDAAMTRATKPVRLEYERFQMNLIRETKNYSVFEIGSFNNPKSKVVGTVYVPKKRGVNSIELIMHAPKDVK